MSELRGHDRLLDPRTRPLLAKLERLMRSMLGTAPMWLLAKVPVIFLIALLSTSSASPETTPQRSVLVLYQAITTLSSICHRCCACAGGTRRFPYLAKK